MTPQSLHVDGASLRIDWGAPAGSATLGAAALRRACRCAACQRNVRLGESVATPEQIGLVDVTAVGSYGVQLHFSDGHDRGIYPWAYLAELAAPAPPGGAASKPAAR